MIEAYCPVCEETFNPEDENDTIHGICGTQCEITGEWIRP